MARGEGASALKHAELTSGGSRHSAVTSWNKKKGQAPNVVNVARPLAVRWIQLAETQGLGFLAQNFSNRRFCLHGFKER